MLVAAALLPVLNVTLSVALLRLGAVYHGYYGPGYGFALAMLTTLAFSLPVLERKLGRLEYETFRWQ